MANLLTLARVVLIFLVIAVWTRKIYLDVGWIDVAMVPLLGWAIFMDALDGWVARRRHENSEAGALFDIAGDRIVELVLWVFFAIPKTPDDRPLVTYWVPVVIITRTVLTDVVRSVAFGQGKTPFGEKTMMDSRWAKALVSSRWSRALYGFAKAITFCALGVLLAATQRKVFSEELRLGVDILVYLTTAFCVIRAVPVLWDGRRYFVVSRPHPS